MEAPIDGLSLKSEEVQSPEGVKLHDAVGGLYYAKHGEYSDAIIVSTGLADREGLLGLGVTPRIAGDQKKVKDTVNMLEKLNYWANTRTLVGLGLAANRKKQVVRALINHIIQSVAGIKWAEIEERIVQKNDKKYVCGRRRALIGQIGPIATPLYQHAIEGNDTPEWFVEFVQSYLPSCDKYFARFAASIACQPETLIEQYPDDIQDMILKSKNEENAKLIRGARFAYIVRKILSNEKCHRNMDE